MSKLIIAVITLVFLFSANGYSMGRNLREYRRIIREIEIEDVDLSGLEDGVYYGSKDAILVSAEVWVTISERTITKIELVHKHGRGAKADPIVDTVQEKQSLKVDMVTGATSSSKVILKAIENALKSEPLEENL